MIMHGIVVGHLSHAHLKFLDKPIRHARAFGAAFEYDTAANHCACLSKNQVELPPNSCLRIPRNQKH